MKTKLIIAAFITLVLVQSYALAKDSFKPPTWDPTYGMPLPHKMQSGGPDASWIWTRDVRDNQTILARKEFKLKSAPENTRLYITADDYFTVWVNGKNVASSGPEQGNDRVWQNVRSVDVGKILHPGNNVIAVKAINAGGSAGLLVRLESKGHSLLLSNAAWKVSELPSEPDGWTSAAFDDSAWKSATVEAEIGEGPWQTLNGWPNSNASASYLYHLPIDPVAVSNMHDGGGKIDDADRLVDHSGPMTVQMAPADSKDYPGILVDFGKELSGRIQVTVDKSAVVMIGTGESSGEALLGPWGGIHTLNAEGQSTVSTPYSAFRYAHILFAPSINGESTIKVLKVTCDHDYYPVAYRGSFDCSDPLLTKIWYTGAYTAHLCMQQEIWDAPKRDRAMWMGDLHVSGEVINNIFADHFLMERTIEKLRINSKGDEVNGIPGYSCAWICGLADLYRHIGDMDYLKRQHESLILTMETLKSEEDDRGTFVNKLGKWPFVDWAPDFNRESPLARQATQFFMVKAAQEAEYLFNELGDKENAQKAETWHSDLIAAAQKYFTLPDNTFSDRRQDNAMAIYSGTANSEETQAIYNKVLQPESPAWKMVATPYYNNYVIFAMSEAGHTTDALTILRNYWGGMLAEGATTFWEGYDPSWPKKDFHRHLQADNGTGFFVSLCHGWSTGATNLLTERVLGVQSTGAGFKTCIIAPDMAGLKWAEGDVPTPTGLIHVRAEETNTGMQVRVKLPRNTIATAMLHGPQLTVNGKKMTKTETKLVGPGQWTLVSLP
jgi:hypothetical protein